MKVGCGFGASATYKHDPWGISRPIPAQLSVNFPHDGPTIHDSLCLLAQDEWVECPKRDPVATHESDVSPKLSRGGLLRKRLARPSSCRRIRTIVKQLAAAKSSQCPFTYLSRDILRFRLEAVASRRVGIRF